MTVVTLHELVPTRQPPAPGQLVSVRNRRFVVTAIAASSAHEERAEPQNLVTLSSVEDDALGEELQVVWEIEPGAAILERASMPELSGFDEPGRLDAFINVVRRGAMSQADTGAQPMRFGELPEEIQCRFTRHRNLFNDPVGKCGTQPRLLLRKIPCNFIHHVLGDHESMGVPRDQVHPVNPQKVDQHGRIRDDDNSLALAAHP